MNESSRKHFKKVPLWTTFVLALFLHLIIVVFFFQFSTKNPYLTTFNPANVIPLTLSGNELVTAQSEPAQKIIKPRNTFGNLTGVKLNQTTTIKTGKIKGDGTGAEVESTGVPTQSLKSGTVDFDQSIVTFAQPNYPKLAQRRGLEGNVTIRLGVSPEGLPVTPVVIKSSGHQSLDQAALNATSYWRFQKHSSFDLIYVEKIIVFKLNN